MIPSVAPINFGTVVSGSDELPAAVSATYFYYRAAGFLVPSITGKYIIGVNCQDGCNLYIGNRPLFEGIDKTDTASSSLAYTRSASIYLTKGVAYPITVEWQHGTGGSYQLQLIWTPPLGSAVLIPGTNISNVAGSITGVLTGNWWNGTAGLWYPSGNGNIDFSNPNLPNKTIDHVSDGTTYARVLSSTIQDGVVTGIKGGGSSVIPAGAGPGLATAPRGNLLMTDGNGDVDDAGIAVGEVLLTSGGSEMSGDLSMASGTGVVWNGDTGVSRIGSGHLAIGDGTDGDVSGELECTALTIHGALTDSTASPGASGYVLSSTGTGTEWVAGGGGGGAIVLLQTVNASGSATLDLTALSGAYDEYMIEVVCLVGSANGFALMAQLSTNGGSSYDSTTTNYIGGSHYDRMDAGGAGDNSGETGFPGAYLTDSYNSGQPGVSASIKFFNDASGSNYRQFIYQTNGPGNGGGYYTQTGGAIWKNATQANAIRILLNTGNMTSGSICLYGIAH